MPKQNFDFFTKPGFSVEVAHSLAVFSEIAYSSPDYICKKLDELGFGRVVLFNNHGTQAFLAMHKKFAVLAFRGTEKDFKDIFTDVNFFKKKTREGDFKVHTGFYDALNLVWGSEEKSSYKGKIKVEFGVKGVLHYLEAIKVPLFFTGHSLGGALATLACKKFRPHCLYTFGSPRVVDSMLSDYLNSEREVYRVVNSTDIVTWVPLPFGYKHTGNLVYIDANGKINQNYKMSMGLEIFSEIMALISLILPNSIVKKMQLKLFRNHSITEYVKNLV